MDYKFTSAFSLSSSLNISLTRGKPSAYYADHYTKKCVSYNSAPFSPETDLELM